MKGQLIVFLLILGLVNSGEVKQADVCTCTLLKSSVDCVALTGCKWKATTTGSTTGTCEKSTTAGTGTTETQSGSYCSLVSEANCASTRGCAYIGGACTNFAGCTAYDKTTNPECQSISKWCNSNGTICTVGQACSTYKTQTQCEESASNSGTGKCVYENNTCRDQKCSEAPATLKTDAACRVFLSTCVTSGKGCSTSPLPACASLVVTASDDCVGLIGSDGYCEAATTGVKCQVKDCKGNTTSKTDAGCVEYQIGCVTNGSGCVKSPLQACSTYTGTDACNSYIGSDGPCEAPTTGTACKARQCTSAPVSYNTNSDCDGYKKNCVTTGKGCIATLGACSSYQGTTDTCSGMIGTDGRCKGSSATVAGPCLAITCAEAPATNNTNALCNTHQAGCKTTGKGCITTLGACSSYTGDQTTCEGYIGTDGKCKGVGASSAACTPKVCTDAPASLTTNEDCQNYQSTCLANSTGGGCFTAGTCPTLGKQTNCAGLTTCSWNPICVANDACTRFTDAAVCYENLGGNKKCFWATTCRDRVCSDAPATTVTDADCDKFLTGCLTNKKGCLDSTVTCTGYQGDKATCETFSRKCTNSAAATSTTNCTEVLCSANVTATSDSDCITYKNSCLTKGTGCIDKTALCSAYSGTQADCAKFTGNGIKCYNTSNATAASACIDKTCANAANTVITDGDCDAFLKGCLTTGAGCIAKDQACSAYSGTETQCAKFTGNSIKCTNVDTCQDRTCADKATAASQDECEAYLTGCRFFNNKCVNAGACSAYAGTSLTMCQDVLDGSGTPLKCFWESGSFCTARTCANAAVKTSDADCKGHLSTCRYSKTSGGANQCIASGACTTYYGTADECKLYVNASGDGCWSTGSGTTIVNCIERLCTHVASPTSDQDCKNHLSTCRITKPAGVAGCITQTTCSVYRGTAADCQGYEGSDGKCWGTGAGNNVTCTLRACADKTSPATTDECTSFQNSNFCTFHYVGGTTLTCINASTACTSLSGTTTSCLTLTGSSGSVPCAFNSGSTCKIRICSDKSSPTDNNDCKNYLSSCRFQQSAAGTTSCIAATTTCTTYVGDLTGCKSYVGTTDTVPCWSTGTNGTYAACIVRTCAHLTSPTSNSDCSTHLSTCIITQPTGGNACVASSTVCTTLEGTAAQCKTFLGNNLKCWSTAAATAAATTCIVRLCAHNTTAQTDKECDEFLTGCKTTGRGCVLANTSCTLISGTSTSCDTITAAAATNKCKYGTATSKACIDRTCFDNGDAATNDACEAFLTGCVTKGKGCVPKATVCTQFNGTQTQCAIFVGNGKPCWGASTTVSAACADRKCSDNTTATADSACATFLTGCVTNGLGCIEVTKNCSDYKGIQATCQKFKGTNGTKSCTNTATASATAACTERVCTENTTSLTDAECQTISPECVTKGKGCVAKGLCSSYSGDIVSCGLLTATDGPCKGTANVGLSAACAVRVCTEAPNNLNTDALCKAYHPTCITNGYGCAVSVTCKDLQSQTGCAAVTGCGWTGQCNTIPTDCATFTAAGASACKNAVVSTGMKGCAFVNSVCRALTCEDLPATITTNDDCIAKSTTCTFNGAGCITKGACTGYKTRTICEAASTTDLNGTVPAKCFWDDGTIVGSTVGCRVQKCLDAPVAADTDEKCNTFLAGCKTNGKGCVSSTFTCNQLLTQTFCLKDSALNPCLWTNGGCFPYIQCEDIALTTHTLCQKVSPYCTTDSRKCISFNLCSVYTAAESCIIGTDGSCGWLPTKKCQKFTTCADAKAATQSACEAFNIKCTSDGTNCVEKSTCGSYLTEKACATLGTDGTCFWDKTGTTCRIRTCADANATNSTSTKTHEGCVAFTASTACTTDGTACVSQGECASYTKEAGCKQGTDGVCVYSLPTGQTTGTKTCRLKECADIKGIKKATDCMAQRADCTSDGVNCISKGKCAVYTAKEACLGGGSDGSCAFAPSSSTTPTVGTCKLMTQCSDANSDKDSCEKQGKACIYTAATSNAASSCATATCAALAKGTVCSPVPSFDKLTYTICVTTGTTCAPGEGAALTATTCLSYSAQTYSWNSSDNKCVKCIATQAPSTPTDNGTGTTTTTTTDNNSLWLSIGTLVALLLIE